MATPNLFDPKAQVEKRTGSYLPHWSQDGSTYFVTFRLADSLPQVVLLRRREEGQIIERLKQRGQISNEEILRRKKEIERQVQKALDEGHGKVVLKTPEIAELMQNALRFFDDTRYVLWAWCVMPNHVHAVVQPFPGQELEDVLHSWKSYTAHEINQMLGRKGTLWETESFDHLIRSEGSFLWCVEYTYSNPDKAGLRNWAWRGKRQVSWE